MKNFLFLLAFIISANLMAVNDTLVLASKINDVTVFYNGAHVTRSVQIKLKKGKHVVILDKLANDLMQSSIQVHGVANLKILSVKHNVNNPSDKDKSKEELLIETKIDALEIHLKQLKNTYEVFLLEEKLLHDNSILAKRGDGTAIKDLKEAADFYRLRLTEIKREYLKIVQEFKQVEKQINEQYLLLNKVSSERRQGYSQLHLVVDCERDINTEMTFTYYLTSAAWEPVYDFRVDDISKPLTIVYNANIFQTSGENWDNVNLTLSTANPTLGGEKPELSERNLSFGTNSSSSQPRNQNAGTLMGKLIDKDSKEVLPFGNIEIFMAGMKVNTTVSNFDGEYILRPLPSGKYDVKVAFIGMRPVVVQNVQISPDRITFLNIELEKIGVNLNEVSLIDYIPAPINIDGGSTGGTVRRQEISRMPGRDANSVAVTVGGVYSQDAEVGSIRGSRSEGTVTYVDGQVVKSSASTTKYSIASESNASLANLEFKIEIPYSIPNDGSDKSIKIKEVSVPVNYIYYLVPKIDKDAFLTAEIINWVDLNLLTAKSNIYFQGTFVGQSQVDANRISDTLSISLGRDRSVIVQREGNKELNDRRLIGSNYRQTVAWDIDIRNNRNNKIFLVVEDQHPISNQKSISIDKVEAVGAEIDEKTGKIVWKIELEPNERRKLSFYYSVRYPRNLRPVLD